MKRSCFIAVLLIVSSVLFASPMIGDSFSTYGEHVKDGKDSGGISLSVVMGFTGERHIGDIRAEADLAPYDGVLQALNLTASVPLCSTLKHPFSSFFVNPMLYMPEAAGGLQYRPDNRDRWSLYLSLSPLAFRSSDALAEFLVPYALFGMEHHQLDYGIYLFRFTAYFGGNR